MPQRMTAEARDRIVSGNGQALIVVTIVLGLAITASSRARWASPVWRDALRVPYAPATWGAVILTAGLLLLLGQWLDDHHRESRRVLRVGYFTAWLWTAGLATAQISAFIHDNTGTANAVSFIIWGYMSTLYRLRYNGTAADNYE